MASLVPAALFWGMVLAGSFHGLLAFGRNVLGWNAGSEFLVPGTLDGVSVTFGFLAFRAVHKRRDPGRCQRVVWAALLASATVNFAYEYGYTHHNLVASAYMALLSVFGVTIFHEFLAQFEEGAEYVRLSKRPPWGLRWITARRSSRAPSWSQLARDSRCWKASGLAYPRARPGSSSSPAATPRSGPGSARRHAAAVPPGRTCRPSGPRAGRTRPRGRQGLNSAARPPLLHQSSHTDDQRWPFRLFSHPSHTRHDEGGRGNRVGNDTAPPTNDARTSVGPSRPRAGPV